MLPKWLSDWISTTDGRQHIHEMITVVANSDQPAALGRWEPRDPTAQKTLQQIRQNTSSGSAAKTEGTDLAYYNPGGTVYYAGGSDFQAGNYQIRYVLLNSAYGNWLSGGRRMSATTGTSVRLANVYPPPLGPPYVGIQSASWGLARRFWVKAHVYAESDLGGNYPSIIEFVEDWNYAEVTVAQPRRSNEGALSRHWGYSWPSNSIPPDITKSYTAASGSYVHGTYVQSNALQLGYREDMTGNQLH